MHLVRKCILKRVKAKNVIETQIIINVFLKSKYIKISENVIALLFMSNIVLKWLQLKGESASLANMTPVWGAIRSGLKITT